MKIGSIIKEKRTKICLKQDYISKNLQYFGDSTEGAIAGGK